MNKEEIKTYGEFRSKNLSLVAYDVLAQEPDSDIQPNADSLPSNRSILAEELLRVAFTNTEQNDFPEQAEIAHLTIINRGKTDEANIIRPDTSDSSSGANIYFQRAVLAAEIVSQMYTDPTFGHVKFMKVFEVCQFDAELGDLETQYSRQAAGPLDRTLLHSLDKQLEQQKWFKAIKQDKRYVYQPLEKVGGHKHYFMRYWEDKEVAIQRVITLFKPLKTQAAEIVATLYTAWNDLLIAGKQPADNEIVLEATVKWHEAKNKITQEEWNWGLNFLRRNTLIPRGVGRATKSSPSLRPKQQRKKSSMAALRNEADVLVPSSSQIPTLDLGLGEIENDLSTRVRINGRFGVLIAETPTNDGNCIVMVQLDGETKPRKFVSPPAVVERLHK